MATSRLGLAHGDDGTLGDHGKVGIRHDGGNFDDPVAFRDEAGHLEIDPDEAVGLCHVAADLTRG
jgi:hypothetical protein